MTLYFLLHHQESVVRSKVLHLRLQERAAKVKFTCALHPPPLTRMEQTARDATSVSTDMAAHYYNLHLKTALLHMVYLPRQNITWCLVPKVGLFVSYSYILIMHKHFLLSLYLMVFIVIFLLTRWRHLPGH